MTVEFKFERLKVVLKMMDKGKTIGPFDIPRGGCTLRVMGAIGPT